MTPAFIILSWGRFSYKQEDEALRVLLSDLCLRVAWSPADSGYLGPSPAVYIGGGRSLDHNPGRTISQGGDEP